MTAAIVVLLDRALKATVVATLPLGSSVAVMPWLNLVPVLNPSAAFYLLASFKPAQGPEPRGQRDAS